MPDVSPRNAVLGAWDGRESLGERAPDGNANRGVGGLGGWRPPTGLQRCSGAAGAARAGRRGAMGLPRLSPTPTLPNPGVRGAGQPGGRERDAGRRRSPRWWC